jgi:hypothetical protein
MYVINYAVIIRNIVDKSLINSRDHDLTICINYELLFFFFQKILCFYTLLKQSNRETIETRQ